ncbi:MAG TPA: right-handed parallel beta-helix repeat-containing protein [Bacillota bacterium]|nr:right-handed parallel beta-helix repeat-containing protein [Bacillota bacterium]HOL11023.1 right-handed parallel beta-helix repeat-containing protein [Bacillota bacterium]
MLRHIDVCNSKFDGFKDHKTEAGENIYEDIRSYNNNGKGFCISTSNNILSKCVAWDNVDRDGDEPGEHGDGFAMNDGAENNRFIECVSYRNSDDGFDTYGSRRNVFIRCIAYQNGINRLNLNPFAGDGNGFKLGIAFGDESQAHNIAFRCLAYNNRLAGFDFNGGAGNYIINCTAYSDKPVEFKNPRTFKMGDRSGLANYLINNLAYPAPAEEDITDELTRAAQRTNSWNSYTIKTTDLLSLAPNSPNFMKLSASSPLRNKGTDISQNSAYSEVVSRLINTDLGYIGLTDLGYIGLPDLGCFED